MLKHIWTSGYKIMAIIDLVEFMLLGSSSKFLMKLKMIGPDVKICIDYLKTFMKNVAMVANFSSSLAELLKQINSLVKGRCNKK